MERGAMSEEGNDVVGWSWIAQKLGIPKWAQVLTAAAVVVLIFGYRQLDGLKERIVESDKHFIKIESALHVLASRQLPNEKDLIREVAGRNQKGGQRNSAERIEPIARSNDGS
jgi:hypothetical protein